jgi:hypothetical protein
MSHEYCVLTWNFLACMLCIRVVEGVCGESVVRRGDCGHIQYLGCDAKAHKQVRIYRPIHPTPSGDIQVVM